MIVTRLNVSISLMPDDERRLERLRMQIGQQEGKIPSVSEVIRQGLFCLEETNK